MNVRWAFPIVLLVAITGGPLGLAAFSAEPPAEEPAPIQILVIAGPCSHPPGTHEAAAGARLLKHCLETADNVTPVKVIVEYDWPSDPGVLQLPPPFRDHEYLRPMMVSSTGIVSSGIVSPTVVSGSGGIVS